jgi:hypothetical protein
MRIALGAWVGRFAAMYSVKLVRRDLAYYAPIRGIAGVLVALCIERPMVMLLSDFTFFLHGRHPFEMGNVQWWSGRMFAWLLLIVAIALRAPGPGFYDAEPVMINATLAANRSVEPLLRNAAALSEPLLATVPWSMRPDVLAALAATLFVVWLLSHLAFFHLCKRGYWPSFVTTHNAAAYTRLKWNAAQSDEKRAALLVKLHPDVLRLIAADARLFIAAHWRESPDDRPAWMTERWLRAAPSSVLPNKVLRALGGKHRRRSTLTEQLELLNDKVPPVPDRAALPDASAAPPESVVVDAASLTESPPPELLAVVPTAGS